MKPFSIPISMLKEFIFCPRIPYYSLVRNIKTSLPFWVESGSEYHIKRKKLLIKNRSKILHQNPEFFFDEKVHSEVHNIHGIIDCLIVLKGETIPVEFKLKFQDKVNRAHKIQLTAYTLCLLEKNVEINRALVISGPHARNRFFKINSQIIDETINTIERLQSVLSRGLVPDSDAKPVKCAQCRFLIFCSDRNI